MSLIIRIETDNAAFEQNPNFQIKKMLEAALKYKIQKNDSGKLQDVNGNTCGEWSWE